MISIPALVIPEVRMEDIVTIMDVMDDVNPVHVDHDLVRKLGLRGPVNQGPANLGYVLNMFIAWAGSPDAIRHVKVRFRAISCPGDRLEARGRVVDVKDEGGESIADCTFELVRDGGEVVLTGSARVAITEGALDAR